MESLQAEIQRLVDEGLASNERHANELRERDEQHAAQVANLQRALDSRDIIGQAKGIIVATKRCTADEAFALLREQSQVENRKLAEVAMEIASNAARRPQSTD